VHGELLNPSAALKEAGPRSAKQSFTTGVAKGRSWRYASGPRTGKSVTNVAGLDGNGLVVNSIDSNAKINNLTNDFRGSRVWTVGGGTLTTTAGFYASSQDVDLCRARRAAR